MTQAYDGLLSWFSPGRHGKRVHHKTKATWQNFGRYPAVEVLESRRLLVSRVFLDFGDYFNATPAAPYNNVSTISVTPTSLDSALVGGTTAAANHFQDQLGLLKSNLAGGSNLRIVTYNTDEFDQGNDNNITASYAGIPTVLQAIGLHHIGTNAQPIDVLGLEDIIREPELTLPDIVAALNGIYGAGTYAFDTTPDPHAAGHGPVGLVYNTHTVQVIKATALSDGVYSGARGNARGGTVPTAPMRYQLRPVGSGPEADFYMYLSYASNDDPRSRYMEAEEIRDDAGTLPANTHIMYSGDWELSNGSNEDAYRCLTGQTTSDGINWATAAPSTTVGRDPTSTTGTTTSWKSDDPTANYLYSYSTSSLESRLDLQLVNTAMISQAGVQLATDFSDPFTDHYPSIKYHYAYIAFGNNGTTPVGAPTNGPGNTSLDDLLNSPLNPATVLNDLMEPYSGNNNQFVGSDHLPIVADYVITTGSDIQYTLVPFAGLLNSSLNPTPFAADAQTLEIAITAQIQRALEPYDIQVISSAENNHDTLIALSAHL